MDAVPTGARAPLGSGACRRFGTPLADAAVPGPLFRVWGCAVGKRDKGLDRATQEALLMQAAEEAAALGHEFELQEARGEDDDSAAPTPARHVVRKAPRPFDAAMRYLGPGRR